MKNKKAFTLVELLAVIVVLAIILLISIPTILGIIEKAKEDSFRSSVRGVFHAIELYNAKTSKISGTIEELKMNGEVLTGTWKFVEGQVIVFHVSNGVYMIEELTNANKGTAFTIQKIGASITPPEDEKNPQLIRIIENYTHELGSSYSVQHLYTVDYGTSSGTVICKVEEVSIDDLKILSEGKHILSCIATNSAGKSSEEILVTITVIRPYLVDTVTIGDYVDYDAGTWASTVAKPTTYGNFGGYNAGGSKNESVSCDGSNLQQSNNGWRVLAKTGSGSTGTVTLVHAGTPECYYHSGSNTLNSATKLNNRAKEQYLNKIYATSARSIQCNDLTTYDSTACTTASPTITNNTIKIGLSYWLADMYNKEYLRMATGGGWISFNHVATYALRPVVVLKAGILKTGGTGNSLDSYQIAV